MSRAQPVTQGSQVIENFDVSPDGRWLVFDSDRGGVQQIYRMPVAGGDVEQLTSGDNPAFAPQFSPNSREIAYHAFQSGTRQIFLIPAEGGTSIQVTSGSEQYWAPRWSPDGRTLSIVKAPLSPNRETDLVSRDSRGHWGSPRTLLKGGGLAPFAPNGHWVVTATGGVALPSLEVVAVAGGEHRVLLAVQDPATDVAPVGPYTYVCAWSSDGRAVYFVGRDPKDGILGIWRVPLAGGPARAAVRFDDPERPWHRNGIALQGDRFYFTLGDRQSDLWMAEIPTAR
jgi:dipeptidyl aminopeptidase/acylaminoacyl peptidase